MIFDNLKILFSFHKSDAMYLERLEYFLPIAKRYFKNVDIFHREKIRAGDIKEEVFNSHLRRSNIIFILLSPDHIFSEEVDLIKEHASQHRECLIVPITLRKCQWKLESLFSKRLTTPKGEKYLTDYNDKDSFWDEIYDDMIQVFQNIANRENGSLRIYMNTTITSYPVRAGSEGNEYSQEPIEDLSNYIEVKDISSSARMFPVIGDSMTGKFEEGDYVICEKIFGKDGTIVMENKKTLVAIQQKIMTWKKEGKNKKYTCVVETTESGLLLKYIENIDLKEAHITLSSHNPIYKNISFSLNDIKALWKVKKVQSIRDID